MLHNPAHFLVFTLAIFFALFLHLNKNEKWLLLLHAFYDHKVKVTGIYSCYFFDLFTFT